MIKTLAELHCDECKTYCEVSIVNGIPDRPKGWHVKRWKPGVLNREVKPDMHFCSTECANKHKAASLEALSKQRESE